MLVHKNINEDHYAVVGGRVKIGENSEQTLRREILEEMGKEIVIEGYVSTIENFFNAEGMPFHEIMFVYKAEFADENDKKILDTINNNEGEDDLRYEWIDLDKIDEVPLKPKVVKEIIKDGIFPVHRINID